MQSIRLLVCTYCLNSVRPFVSLSFEQADYANILIILITIRRQIAENVLNYRDLSSNRILKLPATFLLTNADLQNLQLSHNLIEDISECPFDSLVHLKKLDLSNNLIKTLGKVHLLAIDAQFINRFKQYTGRVYVMMRIFRKWLNLTTKCTIFSFFCCLRSM